MKRTIVIHACPVLLCGLLLAGCSNARGQTSATVASPAVGAPPPPNVVPVADASLFTVDHPEQFPLVVATEHPTTSELVVTGAVTP